MVRGSVIVPIDRSNIVVFGEKQQQQQQQPSHGGVVSSPFSRQKDTTKTTTAEQPQHYGERGMTGGGGKSESRMFASNLHRHSNTTTTTRNNNQTQENLATRTPLTTGAGAAEQALSISQQQQEQERLPNNDARMTAAQAVATGGVANLDFRMVPDVPAAAAMYSQEAAAAAAAAAAETLSPQDHEDDACFDCDDVNVPPSAPVAAASQLKPQEACLQDTPPPSVCRKNFVFPGAPSTNASVTGSAIVASSLASSADGGSEVEASSMASSGGNTASILARRYPHVLYSAIGGSLEDPTMNPPPAWKPSGTKFEFPSTALMLPPGAVSSTRTASGKQQARNGALGSTGSASTRKPFKPEQSRKLIAAGPAARLQGASHAEGSRATSNAPKAGLLSAKLSEMQNSLKSNSEGADVVASSSTGGVKTSTNSASDTTTLQDEVRPPDSLNAGADAKPAKSDSSRNKTSNASSTQKSTENQDVKQPSRPASKKPSSLRPSGKRADSDRQQSRKSVKKVLIAVSENNTRGASKVKPPPNLGESKQQASQRNSKQPQQDGPIALFRPSSDAYTPRMGKKQIKYKPAEMRTPVQKMATPLGTLSRPNFRDALRRVAMIIRQHVVKIEQRFENKIIHDDGLFSEQMKIEFSEDQFATPKYKCTMVRVPMARAGMQYGLKLIRPQYDIPTENEIYEFAHRLFKAVQLSSECSIVCLIYVERLMEQAKVPLLASTWRPIFMCGLLLASKVWQDLSSWNIEFASVYPQYSLDAINRLERLFLRMVKWDLYISSSMYAKYYFALRSLTEKPDFRKRYNRMVGGVDRVQASEALKIEQRSTQVKEEALLQLSRSM